MTNWFTKLLLSARSDRAENSIMQTITIAVSTILIAAGTATAPGIMNSQRENVVRTQLVNMVFAQEAWIAAKGTVNQNFVPSNGGLDNLSKWKYPYSFATSSFKENPTVQWCYKNEYIISGTAKSGKVYFVSSENPNAVERAKLEVPTTCKPGYVPPVNVEPTVPDRLAAPTGIPSSITMTNGIENLTWAGVTCGPTTAPAYQIRVTYGNGSTKSGAWSSSNNQSLDFLDDNYKVKGVKTNYKVAAKCRSLEKGDLSKNETISTQVFAYTAP
jgi:hypothetical protein